MVGVSRGGMTSGGCCGTIESSGIFIDIYLSRYARTPAGKLHRISIQVSEVCVHLATVHQRSALASRCDTTCTGQGKVENEEQEGTGRMPQQVDARPTRHATPAHDGTPSKAYPRMRCLSTQSNHGK